MSHVNSTSGERVVSMVRLTPFTLGSTGAMKHFIGEVWRFRSMNPFFEMCAIKFSKYPIGGS
jgi:hypothetical protein